jgi:hypothetical protein
MGCGGWSLDKPDVVVSSYDGVIWAAEHGARVISCSWGSDNSDNTSQRIMRTCRENGIIIVAAAGNDGVTKMHYPAGYADVISVASIDSDHSLSYFSNRGKWVTVAAPGGYNKKIGSWFSIFSTVFHYSTLGMAPSSPFYQQRYDRMNGTSMACPIVASLVALMLSKDSTLTFDQVVTILQNSAQDKEYGLNINRLSGTIDAAAAINVVIASRGKRGNAVRSLSAERIFFDSVRVQWAASEDGLAIKGYRIYCNDILLDSCYADTVLYDRITESGTKSYIVFPVYQDEEILQVRSSVNVDIPAFYRLSLSSSVGGSAVPLSAGFPRYKEDQIVVVQAIPDTGYVFVEWGGTNELSRFNEYFAITMTENISLHATFAPDSASAIEEINFSGSDGLKIFPNPVKDILTVDCRYCYEKLIKIDVLDLTGRKIFTELNSKTVNVSSLKNGIYFLRITSSPAASGSVSHDVKTIKFIKSSD